MENKKNIGSFLILGMAVWSAGCDNASPISSSDDIDTPCAVEEYAVPTDWSGPSESAVVNAVQANLPVGVVWEGDGRSMWEGSDAGTDKESASLSVTVTRTNDPAYIHHIFPSGSSPCLEEGEYLTLPVVMTLTFTGETGGAEAVMPGEIVALSTDLTDIHPSFRYWDAESFTLSGEWLEAANQEAIERRGTTDGVEYVIEVWSDLGHEGGGDGWNNGRISFSAIDENSQFTLSDGWWSLGESAPE